MHERADAGEGQAWPNAPSPPSSQTPSRMNEHANIPDRVSWHISIWLLMQASSVCLVPQSSQSWPKSQRAALEPDAVQKGGAAQPSKPVSGG